MSPTGQPARFGSGQSVPRIEDKALVTGAGRYADDVPLENLHFAAFLRSPHAHAVIRSIDTSAASSMPGVVAVYTGADLQAAKAGPLPSVAEGWKRPDGTAAISPHRWPLAVGRVYFTGQAVCAVIADSVYHAQQAAEAIRVDYTDLPAVTSIDAALATDAPCLVEGSDDNICAAMSHGDAQACDAAFASAAHIVAMDLINQRVSPVTLEPRSCTAFSDGGRLNVRLSSQMPTLVRATLANNILHLPVEDIRVQVGDVGGGFGMKTGLYMEDAVIAFAAHTTGVPVRWTATRSEEFLSASHGRDLVTHAELALDDEGRILAYRNRSDADVGSLVIATGVAIQLMIGPWVATSVYDIPLIDFNFRAVLTNKAPTGAYRGAGRPEAIYTIERILDKAARQLGLTATEIRRRNLVKPQQMPYVNAMQQKYDSGNFESMLDQGMALADWDGFESRCQESLSREKVRGRGLVTFLEWTGGMTFEESVTILARADGKIEIATALMPMGQGISTCFAQVVSDVLGVAVSDIIVRHGDTDKLNGFGSAGSRSIFTGGSALQVASAELIEKSRKLAADELECAPGDVVYADTAFTVSGTDVSISLFDLAAKQASSSIDIASTSSVDDSTWPNGCHVCEVEIEPATGVVTVDRYDNINDVGNVINPAIVIGQLEGGALQGIGQALQEAVVYDAQNGQLQTASLLDYTLSRASDTCFYRTEVDQSIPCKNNPLGVKGVGELGTIGATPAVANAVVDALIRAGVPAEKAETLQMPITSGKVWQMLQQTSV